LTFLIDYKSVFYMNTKITMENLLIIIGLIINQKVKYCYFKNLNLQIFFKNSKKILFSNLFLKNIHIIAFYFLLLDILDKIKFIVLNIIHKVIYLFDIIYFD
jgi:hypothetical protein